MQTAVTGDVQARLMDSQQPMKMAAAEALYNTSGTPAALLAFVGLRLTRRRRVPRARCSTGPRSGASRCPT
jgi:cytochrome bd-type quinol oxidase subunit 1